MENGFNPQYDDLKKEDTIYVGKSYKNNGSEDEFRTMEILTSQNGTLLTEKNKEENSKPIDFNIIERETLFLSPSGQIKIFCWLIEDNEKIGIRGLHISRRASKGVYGSQEVTLNAKSVVLLKNFLNNIQVVDTSNKNAFKVPVSELDDKKYNSIITEEEFTKIIKSNIKSIDDFYNLLSLEKMKLNIDRLKSIISGGYQNEIEIQKFLKENLWMFGNDYSFIIEDNKINAKNILDIMPKTSENYADIIEVKLPNEKLFNWDPSHSNLYPTSHLTKAISQTQNYIFELEKKMTDEEYKEIRECNIVRPKGIILFGSNEELSIEERNYLRLLNSSYTNISIITYQQLLDKALTTINLLKKYN